MAICFNQFSSRRLFTLQTKITVKNDPYDTRLRSLNALNDESVDAFIGLISAYLPQSHSLHYAHCIRLVSVVVVFSVMQFLKTNISRGSVATSFRCGGICNDLSCSV